MLLLDGLDMLVLVQLLCNLVLQYISLNYHGYFFEFRPTPIFNVYIVIFS
jgi:hypothetical protein